ncbi:MAG TPA: hypothetical protein VK503_06830 [Candidatus Bathyarchaeia archaeon]|nr:hypothetical protein [Candidatus Bathyarchaeia archaeon]
MTIVKIVPILGTIVLLGVIVQLVLGFQIADAGARNLITPHLMIGILGLALVAILTIVSFRAASATIHSKLMMTVLTILVLVQVFVGFQLLRGFESYVVLHESIGLLVLILALVTGIVTMRSAKKRD